MDMHTYMHLHRTMVRLVASATGRAGCREVCFGGLTPETSHVKALQQSQTGGTRYCSWDTSLCAPGAFTQNVKNGLFKKKQTCSYQTAVALI